MRIMVPGSNMPDGILIANPPIHFVPVVRKNFNQCRSPASSADNAECLNHDLGRFENYQDKIKKEPLKALLNNAIL
jgi:hypothetical protein